MKVPFTWKPTGWFPIGFSADFPQGEVRPLKYFGRDLVGYRDDDGEVHVLDAHCLHLGAHLGHHGKVNGNCVECPYHGWGWGPDGENKYIPYEDRPNVSKKLRAWPVDERHEYVFMWHDPNGGPPRWELPSLFDVAPHLPSSHDAYYRGVPELSIKYRGEPVHPQIALENGPDSEHFHYVHAATVHPQLLSYETEGPFWKIVTVWPKAGGAEGEYAMKLHAMSPGVAGSMSAFEAKNWHYRLLFFVTPVDEETSDCFYTIFWPRAEGDTSAAPPPEVVERVEKEFISALWDDLEIWRYQVYVEHPSLAKQDARPYGALRKWARQFYEIPADA
jgi:phenylpropionate dioxygenase-like ring-hydroxylating dioxygenase large terminal subunit